MIQTPRDASRKALAQMGSIVGEVEIGVAHVPRVVGLAHFGVDAEGEAAVDSIGCG